MSEKRWALLIGINEYEHLSERQQLHGCVNDTAVWMDVLTSASLGFGFPQDGITQLTNATATRDGILNAFDELLARVRPDDVVFMHYSGHGSQMKAAIEGDEGDNFDETIVPSDARAPDSSRKDISDNEINRLLRSLTAKTPRVTMVFDSCHSASVTRDLSPEAQVRGIEPDLRSPSPLEIELATGDAGPTRGPQPGIRHTVLAGCREEEQSHEFRPPEAPKHGALTWYLTRALMDARPGATYRDVFETAAAKVTGAYASQHPQIEGAIDREIFGVLDRKPMRFLPVKSRNGNVVTLGGGAAQTVEVGSRWAAYPAGTREPTPEDRLATLVVTAAAPTSATATGENGAVLPDAVGAGTRVVREGRKVGDAADELALRVGVANDGRELSELIGTSLLLERVEPDDPTAYARVFTIAPREAATADDPVRHLGRLDEATVAVVGPDGHLLVPTRGAATAETPAQVCADLETFARYKRVLDLENPGSGLAGVVDLELLRKVPNGGAIVAEPDWVVATPDPAAGKVVYDDGELMGVRLTSRHDAPLYPALLDLSLTYDVSVFPDCSGKDVLGARLSRNLVAQWDGSGYPVGMTGFPFVKNHGNDADSGIETLKLFVTTQEADYTFLEQEGVRAREVDERGGIQLKKRGDDGDDWTTVTRQFVIRRRA